jgi:two-component system, NarL family, response regulator NreC
MAPQSDGDRLEVTRQVGQRSPRTRVLILSMYSNEASVLEALRSGAAGYVLKESPATDLVRAVHEVAAGRRNLSNSCPGPNPSRF